MSSYSFIPIPKLQRIEHASILEAKGKQQWRRLTGTGFDEVSWRSRRRSKWAAFTKRHAVSITEYATCMYNAITTYRRDWDVSDARVFVPTTWCKDILTCSRQTSPFFLQLSWVACRQTSRRWCPWRASCMTSVVAAVPGWWAPDDAWSPSQAGTGADRDGDAVNNVTNLHSRACRYLIMLTVANAPTDNRNPVSTELTNSHMLEFAHTHSQL